MITSQAHNKFNQMVRKLDNIIKKVRNFLVLTDLFNLNSRIV